MKTQPRQLPTIAFALACLFLDTSVAQKPDSVPPVGNGDLVALSALAKDVAMRGQGARQQLVVSGHYANFGVRDLSSAVERSLLLMKASGEVPHGGGARLLSGSRDYELVARWIRSGMPFGRASDPKAVGLTIAPDHRLIARRSNQQITVTARYSDGTARDVTADAEYHSNDPELLEVNHSGVVKTHHLAGEGAAMARYLGHVAVFRATIPLAHQPEA